MSEPEDQRGSREFDPAQYWENRLGRELSLRGVGYVSTGLRFNQWLYRVRARVFRRIVGGLPLQVDKSRILDVGSGTGFYVRQWARLGAREVVGSDLTEVAVAHLREQFPAFEFVRLDIGARAVDLPRSSFDAVSAMDVLFHIVEDERYETAIQNVAELLRPGGLFVFSDNFLHGPAHRLSHQVSRPLAWIEDRVAAAGFEVLARKPMFVRMNAPVDSDDERLQRRWKRVRDAAKREWVGAAVGAIMYPAEILRTRLATESPTTEIMVCRKRGAG